MKNNFLTIGMAFLTAVSGYSSESLIINEQSSYTIVLPDKSVGKNVDNMLKQASEMLAKSFKEATGATMPIVKEKDFKGGKAVYLGNTSAIRTLGFDPEKECDNFEYLLREKDGSIYIAGRDFAHVWSPYLPKYPGDLSLATIGTAKGAVAFAEEFLDVRFLMRGEVGTDYARKKCDVKIPAGLNRHVKPMLDFGTGGWSGESLYAYSNNHFGAGSLHTYGGHSYYSAVPAAKYFNNHPEYFAMAGGKRTSSGNHLCISNPEVQELIYQEALRYLDQGANMVQIAQTDGYFACECDQCKAFGNTDIPGEKLWIIHLDMAKRLLKDRPGKRLHLLAYHPTVHPPRQYKEFPPNVVVELCEYKQENFDEWRSKVKVPGGFSVYIYNWGSYNRTGFTPKRTPEFAAEQVRFFAANNVKGIYRCCCFENIGLESPTYYVYGKMLDDPTQDWQVLASEFYQRAFKEAAVPMATFFKDLYNRVKIYSVLQKSGYFDNQKDSDPRVLLEAIYTPTLLEKLESYLATAEKLAKDPKVILRLKAVRLEFDYAKNLSQCIHFYHAYQLNPCKSSFEPLAKALKRRNEIVTWCEKHEWQSYVPGWPEALLPLWTYGVRCMKSNGRLSGAIGAPLNWDVDKILKENSWSSMGKTMDVLPTKAPVPFDFNAPVWQQGAWHELVFADAKKNHFPSKVKFLYDDHNIYCAVETVIANTAFKVLGQDGPVWDQDCVEIFLDPTGYRTTFYHILFNPVENSTFDEALGLITDPLHPLYGKEDKGWNGKWSYQNRIADEKWYSLTTIPFSTLNTTKPCAGTEWFGNVAREAYGKKQPDSNEKLEAELSIWSPNDESSNFMNPSAFGKLIFK